MGDIKSKDTGPGQATLHSADPSGESGPATELAHAATQIASGASQPAQVHVGETLLEDDGFDTRYEMRALLGKGGMGEVRVCRDRRIGREVAFKVVRERLNEQADMRERFLREAR